MKFNYLIFILLLLIPITTASPNITAWGNNFTNNTNLSFTIDKNTTVSFNATSNITADAWFWGGVDSNDGNNTTISNGTKNFTVMGLHTVSVYGNNSSNNSNTITWNVNVLGSCCYTIEGFVANSLELPLQNARVDFNGSYVFTDAMGNYSFSNGGEGIQPILVRAIGYSNNTQSVNITNDTVLNIMMRERTSGGVKASPGFGGIGLLAVVVVIYLYGKKRL